MKKASTEGNDRRENLRRPLFAEVLVCETDGDGIWWGNLKDISLGGAFVNAEFDLPVDAMATLTVIPRFCPGMRLPAKVVHSEMGRGFGCAFVSLSSFTQMQLIHCLHRDSDHAVV